MGTTALVDHAAAEIKAFRSGVAERTVAQPVDLAALRDAFGADVPDDPTPADEVLRELVKVAEPGWSPRRGRATSAS